jgi:sigma-B regulation protein RsbU (phosphoserine phosphatase)
LWGTMAPELPTKPSKARLLLVDDEPAMLEAHARVLSQYVPLRAEDGIAARNLLSGGGVDVVVCDLGLPGLGGLDLMRWAKEHCPRPLWIVVSAQDTFDAATQALRLGAFDFICKPFLPIQLRTSVANAIRHQELLEERAGLVRGLADNNVRLAESLRSLEVAYKVLRDQRSMLDEDLQRAKRIMRALLPRALPTPEKLRLHVGYRPSSLIGGDLYGAETLDDRHLAVYVADAAGHGVSAALLAVLFKQQLRFYEGGRGPRPPSAVLAELNRALFDECSASGLFVTVVVALIDTEERSATIASAGHPPALLLRATGRDRIDNTGPALGLSTNAEFAERRVALSPGDRLLLYTDGLSAALPPGPSGLDEMARALCTDGADAGQTIDKLFALTEGSEACEDDVTLLLVAAEAGANIIDAQREPTQPAAPSECKLRAASIGDVTWVAVEGRAIWKHAPALRDACVQALDAGRRTVVDLAACTMLDSTALGTLHELAMRSDEGRVLRLQNVGADLRQCFEELSMTRVLSCIAEESRPLPSEMVALQASADSGAQQLILRAHELLSGLSPRNAEEFAGLIEALRREV